MSACRQHSCVAYSAYADAEPIHNLTPVPRWGRFGVSKPIAFPAPSRWKRGEMVIRGPVRGREATEAGSR